MFRYFALGAFPALAFGCAIKPKKEMIYSQSEEMSLPIGSVEVVEAKASAGDLAAMGLVYNHYTFGQFDAKKSLHWLKRLADSGHAPSQFNYGKTLIDEGKKQVGMRFIKMSAAQDYQPAKEYLADKLTRQFQP